LGRVIGIALTIGAVYLIFLILTGAFRALGIFYMDIGNFIQDNWLIWTAIILGLFSAILFYASSTTYRNVKINESFLPNPKRIIEKKYKKGNWFMKLVKKQKKEVTELDLSKLTMEALVKKMAYEMTKPGPVFFKGWGNRRLELDVERVQILRNYVDSIRETGNSLMELQSDAVLSYEKIKKLTKIKQNELESRLIESEKSLDFVNEKYKHELEMMRLEREDREEDVKLKRAQRESIEIDNTIRKLRAEAEYKLMIAKGEKEQQVANILAKAVKYYKDLPNVLKSYVAVQLGNEKSPNPDTDMELQEQLKEFIVRKHQAETKMLESEAEENEAMKDTNVLKLEREKKKYSGNGNL